MTTISEIIQQHLDRYESDNGPQMWDRCLNFGAGKSLMAHTERTWINTDQGDAIPTGLDLIVGWHVLEHITDILPVMEELWEAANPGALAIFEVPYGSHDMAWENPTHVRAMFPQSFIFYGQPTFWREDYGYKGDWKVELVEVNVPAAELTSKGLHQRVRTERNLATVMRGYLRAVKPARPPDRGLMENPPIHYVGEL